MDDLLVVRTSRITHGQPSTQALITEVSQTSVETSRNDILDLLRSDPDLETVHQCLKYLTQRPKYGGTFDIRFPNPLVAQITHALVSIIIPTYWPQFRQDASSKDLKQLLLRAVRNLPALGAILAQLKTTSIGGNSSQTLRRSNEGDEQGSYLIQVIEELFDDNLITDVCHDISNDAPRQQQKLLWRDFIQVVASARIISTVAEYENSRSKVGQTLQRSWLSSGSDYSRWISRNIVKMVLGPDLEPENETMWQVASQMLGNAFSIGYIEIIVEQVTDDLLANGDSSVEKLKKLIHGLKAHEQTKYLTALMLYISRRISKRDGSLFDLSSLKSTPIPVAGSSALLIKILTGNDILKSALIDTLTADNSSATISSPIVLRAVMALFAVDQDSLEIIMEKNLNKFGDKLYIKHSPILQQETTVQILLLATGYLHRRQPMFVFTVARSSTHTQGISNRLAASSERVRWLGMIVGMALSDLIDKPDNRMVFDDDEIKTEEAKWYLQLTRCNDKPGSLQDFRDALLSNSGNKTTIIYKSKTVLSHQKSGKQKQISKPEAKSKSNRKKPTTSVLKIVELDDDDEEDDLIPYPKPDSDPSDSEEDPTLIQRNKPRPPVYIRDLISGLRETESYDRFNVALTNSAGLIRRKANFGKEVSDYAEELASILMNLQDTFEMENFEELRQNAIIAVLIAKPSEIALQLATSFFTGDYSIQQRTAILAALGLGARELAGFNDKPSSAETSFPSKQLPPHLHALYSTSHTNTLNLTAAKLEHTALEPLALDAADKLTGPNALKVRPFSSRLDPAKQAARSRRIENKLAAVVADAFFFPLAGRFRAAYRAAGGAPASVHLSPFLLPTFLRTLAVVLNAAGPGTLALPAMTAELWDLLLGLRAAALAERDVQVLEALLFALLMLLEVNEDKERLARDHGRELVETQEWSRMVLERMQDGGKEGERVRMLAAGVIIRVGEVVERWQRVMTGSFIDS